MPPPLQVELVVGGQTVHVPGKGVEDCIRALVKRPDTELLVAGGPTGEARRQRAVAASCGVGDRVRFLGGVPRDRVPALARPDLVVAAPWYEPFGMVPLEAMACGVPAVGSAVGGLLVPPRGPAALAAAVHRLLKNPSLRRRRGQGAALVHSTLDVFTRLEGANHWWAVPA